jgi:hypothetical protein
VFFLLLTIFLASFCIREDQEFEEESASLCKIDVMKVCLFDICPPSLFCCPAGVAAPPPPKPYPTATVEAIQPLQVVPAQPLQPQQQPIRWTQVHLCRCPLHTAPGSFPPMPYYQDFLYRMGPKQLANVVCVAAQSILLLYQRLLLQMAFGRLIKFSQTSRRKHLYRGCSHPEGGCQCCSCINVRFVGNKLLGISHELVPLIMGMGNKMLLEANPRYSQP